MQYEENEKVFAGFLYDFVNVFDDKFSIGEIYRKLWEFVQLYTYAVNPETLKDTPLILTHLNLLDRTVEGAACPRDRAFSVQYHPESAPGPQDSAYLFDDFIREMEKG